ncbi:MAG TPA: hypothetical protein VFH68_01455 [Polyangia bacterium]|nr:hypothetical protein [Polyangia bacterium]
MIVAAVVALVTVASVGSVVAIDLTGLEKVTVRRQGVLGGFGPNVPFPSKVERRVRHLDVVSLVAGEDEVLTLARSPDGRRFWSSRQWDFGGPDVNVFELDAAGVDLPQDAVLQFVDGFVVPADPLALDVGHRFFKQQNGEAVFELLLEAWVALPARAEIYRPEERRIYPLVPAKGAYDAALARKLQWMVFVPSCPPANRPCVYFGAAKDVCARYRGTKYGSLWIRPKECALK